MSTASHIWNLNRKGYVTSMTAHTGGHSRVSPELTVVEVLTGKVADIGMHAVLYIQKLDRCMRPANHLEVVVEAVEQRLIVVVLLRLL